MVSTFRDYLRFLMMIRNMGELDGVRILRRETVQTMVCNQIPAATGRRAAWVFDKKGQGYSFIGQIQVQHNEKDTIQEKGELKRGNTTLASLAPGTVSGEFGWGGLAGPAWTIDPRADLIVLSMSQTALELDHEENLRFSARRAIHAGIFGPTAGPMKVTDFPPEGHEGVKGGKLRTGLDRPQPDAELNAFLEAEQQALLRGKTLKEIAVGRGNAGHEVPDDEDVDMEGAAAMQRANSSQPPPSAVAVAAAAPPPPEEPAGRALQRTTSSASGGSGPAGDTEPPVETPNPKKRPPPSPATGGPSGRRRHGSAGAGGDEDCPAPEARRARASDAGARRAEAVATAQQVAATPSPGKHRGPVLPGTVASPEELLFSRVAVRPEGCASAQKARVTAVEGDAVEVVTEGSWKAMSLKVAEVSVIDESCLGTSTLVETGPTDFSFLLSGGGSRSAEGKGQAGRSTAAHDAH